MVDENTCANCTQVEPQQETDVAEMEKTEAGCPPVEAEGTDNSAPNQFDDDGYMGGADSVPCATQATQAVE